MPSDTTESHLVALTPRLRIRHFTVADGQFILRLLNERSFIDNIGDRQVRSLPDAERYLRDGPMASYQAHGHGLNCVERRDSGELIGMCGILKRDTLPHPDLGYALLPEHAHQGYAREAAVAVMRHATETLGITRLLAIVNADNSRSIRLLDQLGFTIEAPMALAAGVGVLRYGWTGNAAIPDASGPAPDRVPPQTPACHGGATAADPP